MILIWAATSENRSSGIPTRSDTNQAVQPLKIARDLKFWIQKVEGLYYPCSENRGADQLRGYREADLHLCFRICKNLVFSCRGSKPIISAITGLNFCTSKKLSCEYSVLTIFELFAVPSLPKIINCAAGFQTPLTFQGQGGLDSCCTIIDFLKTGNQLII